MLAAQIISILCALSTFQCFPLTQKIFSVPKQTKLFGVPDDLTVFQDKVIFADISSSVVSQSPSSRELPLFLLGSAFFPEVNYLFI